MRLLPLLAGCGLLVTATAANAQQTILQGGPWVDGHTPMYVGSGSSTPVVQDSGPAGGGAPGLGLSELNITSRGSGSGPFPNSGTGPDGTHFCNFDAPKTSAVGYHYLCWDANALGGGLVDYGAAGGASPLPFNFDINGTLYTFPFVTGGILGPTTTVVGDLPLWNNAAGNLLSDSGVNLSALARLASPAFTGIPTAPTASATTNTTQIATTAQVQSVVASVIGPVGNVTVLPIVNAGTITVSAASQVLVQSEASPATTNYVLPAASNFPNCPSLPKSCPVITITDSAYNVSGSAPMNVTAADGLNVGQSTTFPMPFSGQTQDFVLAGSFWVAK